MVLADQIEKIGRALTAKDLARLLSVSEVTIFKQAAAGGFLLSEWEVAFDFDPRAVANWLRRT